VWLHVEFGICLTHAAYARTNAKALILMYHPVKCEFHTRHPSLHPQKMCSTFGNELIDFREPFHLDCKALKFTMIPFFVMTNPPG
jgi:hypothetical protein